MKLTMTRDAAGRKTVYVLEVPDTERRRLPRDSFDRALQRLTKKGIPDGPAGLHNIAWSLITLGQFAMRLDERIKKADTWPKHQMLERVSMDAPESQGGAHAGAV